MNGKHNRRTFLTATSAGLLTSIAGCTRGGTGSDDSANTDSKSDGGADIPLKKYQQADIDWKQFEDSKINIGAVQHPWVDAIKPAVPIFEKLTGIDVVWNILPENQFRTKRQTDASTGAGQFDVFFMDQVVNQYRHEGWLQPLDPYFDDSSLYDESWYHPGDMFDASKWQAHGGGYSDKWTGLPITVEVQTQFYRTDLYEKHGLTVAETLDQFRQNAKTIHEAESDIAGTVGRGQKGYGMNIYILNTFLREFGTSLWTDFPNNSGLDTDGTIDAAKWYVNLLKDYGPQDASTQTWSDVLTTMQEGRAGHIVADANLFWPDLTGSDSKVGDKIGIAKAPKPADGQFSPNAYNWQISTSKNAKNSKQGFLFMLWATSKPTNTWMHLNNDAAFSVRQSVWKNDEFRSRVGEDFAQITLDSLKAAKPDPFDRKYPQWGQQYSEELQRAIAGQKSAEAAMKKAATVAENIYSG
ncbi:putative ABC transporter substrate-binding protein [Haladaptatus paucihalophilus DX253]|uniref:Carbohydrate ABC transporter substrate-binding protein, CUT1 family n=1 Tax=Haladaptatus paucihalophilus DX253 TaxID=797209 RepID=E7QPC1_HALPU|nr:sugar ABC transporter substrate-binding protein [Haladaptatus paucihalophilus]EFW94037.1 putative ABC transporter substrate-binding protein [Haladaptatus paucihalophilus DX253]SHK63744.1 carbohydrate ABC transporter substrate-binding protein, CUT1 family [Haladaptatus paucihalophilus DX253]